MPGSKIFDFQLHLDQNEPQSGLRAQELKTCITNAGGIIVKEEFGNDDGTYLNIFTSAEHPSDFWDRINQKLDTNNEITRSLIAVCEGSNGWDDYLLLRHCDRDQTIDPLSDDD